MAYFTLENNAYCLPNVNAFLDTRSSDKLSFYLFADDTNLLYADRDIYSLEWVVNAELSKVQEWLVANRLTLKEIYSHKE